MKIIVLYGRYSLGKSTTLNGVIENMQQMPEKYIEKYMSKKKIDSVAIFESQNKTIAISTIGDAYKYMDKDYQEILKAINREPDILICAARSKGDTHEFVCEKAKKEDIFWLSKTAFFNSENSQLERKMHNRINKEQTKQIIDILEDIIL